MSAKVLKSRHVVVVDAEARRDYDNAVEEAYRQGLAEGERRARAHLGEDLETLRREIAEAGSRARSEVADVVSLDATLIVGLATDLADWFLDGAIGVDPGALLRSLQHSLTSISGASGITLYVHPEIAAALEDERPSGVDAVRADPTLGRADHRLVVDGSSIERRWRDAVSSLSADIAATIRSSRSDAPGGRSRQS